MLYNDVSEVRILHCFRETVCLVVKRSLQPLHGTCNSRPEGLCSLLFPETLQETAGCREMSGTLSWEICPDSADSVKTSAVKRQQILGYRRSSFCRQPMPLRKGPLQDGFFLRALHVFAVGKADTLPSKVIKKSYLLRQGTWPAADAEG